MTYRLRTSDIPYLGVSDIPFVVVGSLKLISLTAFLGLLVLAYVFLFQFLCIVSVESTTYKEGLLQKQPEIYQR